MMLDVEERDSEEPKACSNCGNEWGDLLPMDADDTDDTSLLYCQECRTDFQLENWNHFV